MFGLGKKKMDGPAWPVEIVGKRSEKGLSVTFDTGESATIPAELLRVKSPSAEVKGHGAGPGVLVTGKRLVGIQGLEPVGNYAVRIIFDDGHDSGLYTWDLLLDFARNQKQHWKSYENRLKKEGGTRD